MPNLLEVLDDFPSLKVNPSLLISQLPLLQQRFYSISSSPKASPGEVHATIAFVEYKTMGIYLYCMEVELCIIYRITTV
jgi:sulfite reductase alpha subunit-like flavoprotein